MTVAILASRGKLAVWAILSLVLSIVGTVGSLYLSLGLKACPLCFYQRTFIMATAAVLGIGFVVDRGRSALLCLLVLPLALAGLGVAAFHEYLVVFDVLECPKALFGLGTAPAQSLAAFAALTVSVLAGAWPGDRKGAFALALLYGIVCYGVFFVTFLYAIGFVGGLLVPKGIDSGESAPLIESLGVNLGLLTLFAVQHSVMARPAFKRWWTRFVPQAIERSTYVLASSLALVILFWLWRPMSGVIWDVQAASIRLAVWALFWLGWLTVLVSTFLVNHFDLFGLRQVYLFAIGRPYTAVGFRTPGLHQWVRHPIMLGFLVAFWAASTMTVGHLLFAAVTTAYVLLAIQLEERDLVSFHGEEYREYQQQVRMLIPIRRVKRGGTES